MNSSLQFLLQLQAKKKEQNEEYKGIRMDLQEMQHSIQSPSIKSQQTLIKINQQQFIYLTKATKSKLMKQPSFLKLQGPVYVCTGTYGSYLDLGMIIDKCDNPKFANYLFLGNYTGKYSRGIECLVALMTYKVMYGFNFFILRGFMETLQYSKNSFLYSEIIEYFGSPKAWIEVCVMFCCLPFAAVVNDKVFCVHGGISPYLFTFQQINQIHRPFNTLEKGLPHELVFGEISYDPQKQVGFDKGSYFGQGEVQSFMKRTGVRLICRGKEIVQNGYEFVFNQSVVNLCSISSFANLYSNRSAVMMIDDQFNVAFKQINLAISDNNAENQHDLNLMECVLRTKEKKNRLEELQKIQSEKQQLQKKEKQQNQIQREKKEQKRRQKEENRKLRKVEERNAAGKEIKRLKRVTEQYLGKVKRQSFRMKGLCCALCKNQFFFKKKR